MFLAINKKGMESEVHETMQDFYDHCIASPSDITEYEYGDYEFVETSAGEAKLLKNDDVCARLHGWCKIDDNQIARIGGCNGS